MKTTKQFTFIALVAASLALPVFAQASPSNTTPGKIETRIGTLSFDHALPTPETRQKLYDELDYQRAVQAVLWAEPAINNALFRQAMEVVGTPSYVGQWLTSFREFPPRQKPGSFSLDRVMEAMTGGSQKNSN